MSVRGGCAMSGPCRIVTLPDGTKVRVQGDGDVDTEQLQTIIDSIREERARECHALSPFPMPEIAQRIHGRETYWCHREQGHDGPHRWGSREPREWSDPA